jgi:hypothetical protein
MVSGNILPSEFIVDVHQTIRSEVHVQTRRKFLRFVTAAPVMLLASSNPADAMTVDSSRDEEQSQVIALSERWEFRLDPNAATEPSDASNSSVGWEAIRVPDTWQSLGGSPDFTGIAWYRFRFECPSNWTSQHVRIEFEAVNHTAMVFLNEKQVGEHVGKGYTAFTIDLSPHLTFGRDNTLLVRVDNRPNDRMLHFVESDDQNRYRKATCISRGDIALTDCPKLALEMFPSTADAPKNCA